VHATVITLPEPDEIDDRPFEAAIRVRIEAMVTLSSLVFATHRRRIVDLAGRHSLKTKPPHDVVRPPEPEGSAWRACSPSRRTMSRSNPARRAGVRSPPSGVLRSLDGGVAQGRWVAQVNPSRLDKKSV
jgi:hypothetical protein